MTAPLKSSDVLWKYVPSAEDREKSKRKPGMFKLSWDGVFHTIQWEWQFAGRPTTFIRLAVCNLKCSWCDAWYTRRTDTSEFYKEQFDVDINELRSMIDKAQKKFKTKCRDITITGWEPMLQQKVIVDFLSTYGHLYDRIQIETNWTIPPLPEIANNEKIYFNCSPKITSSDNEFKIRYNEKVLTRLMDTKRVIFKFVFSNISDIDEVLNTYSFIPKDLIRLMPEGVLIDEHRKVFDETIDYVVESWCNVAIRCQSIMWDGAKRWV